jgi:hypothetical protein
MNPIPRTATDLFGDQALGLAMAHVEIVHRGLSQNEKNNKNCKILPKYAQKIPSISRWKKIPTYSFFI